MLPIGTASVITPEEAIHELFILNVNAIKRIENS